MSSPAPIRWDRQIQRRLARGEESALGELYDQFAPLVHGLANRVLADQAAAEEITQDVFAHVWEHPESFDPAQGSMRSWIGTLTHRRSVERLRRDAAAGAADGEGEGAPLEPSSVEEEVLAAATAARVQYVVSSLPQALRETLLLTYFGGRTYRQAAKELGIAPATAKHRMRLGLQLLASALSTEPAR
ncbi:sigma-70 family RNA polymerase sigma factor [Streptacidiphilus jiangxiensis]|uniref:RNA polymerase sigma-70 factor, ECF subfamily n=1 Tax=Streptacidiphilus jiangxiensis TaxID=235985 RepID=A0A1H7F5L8_STRJI|nr:sigma-70 family RNA polymerase sigma factor [Streptacidiphilus jiangxiensis]SEK21396.1 RNA polymerase sigma-70 factor, ECF subfamily [Streptacidiphilus jiangxiensis]